MNAWLLIYCWISVTIIYWRNVVYNPLHILVLVRGFLIILQMIIWFNKPQSNLQLIKSCDERGFRYIIGIKLLWYLLMNKGCLQPPSHTVTREKLFWLFYIWLFASANQRYKFRSSLRSMVRSQTISNQLVRIWYTKLPNCGLS